MNIRRATIADVPYLVELNRVTQAMHAAAVPEIFRAEPPDEIVAAAFTASIEAPSALWLIGEEEHPCGYLSADFRELPETWCHVRHQICYIAAIAVNPELRRKGIARALVVELTREAEARGVHRIELSVWSFNAEAKHAFGRLGFRPLMERRVL
jgi:ribosomal protein S18 acetylase RimI-like enzyme